MMAVWKAQDEIVQFLIEKGTLLLDIYVLLRYY